MNEPSDGLFLALPFLGLLLSIALLPGLMPRFWLRNMGWVSLGWSAVVLVLVTVVEGPVIAWHIGWHALLVEYLPFVTMLGALYVVCGGILVRGGPAGTSAGNTLMLAVGMLLGLVLGPTGAAMVLIQPLLAANQHRRRKVHLVLFTIILVANVSGALTPLGNPPLFAGMLRGVPFFWPARFLIGPYLVLTGLLLAAFYGVDRALGAREPAPAAGARPTLRGRRNVLLVVLLALSVMLQTVDLAEMRLLGEPITLSRLGGCFSAMAIAALSWRITPTSIRRANDFAWHPMAEVAILFAGIFVTLAPVSHMLQGGSVQALFPWLQEATGQPDPLAYFWLAGIMSAFLDNAPTYLVFFDMAQVDAHAPGPVLTAISCGAVFFGGLTYIGNAPNLMLRAVASHRGVPMPSFPLYLAMAATVLLPAFLVLSVLFFIGN